jgi:hypothetical protein
MNASQGEPMKIVVLVKEVPDTYGDRKLDLETGLAERSASERVLDEIGERALEVALSYADAHPGTEVAVVSMASEEAAATIRKGLAMGAASALQVVDPALAGADLGVTAAVLAAAVRRAGFDLVITGNLSTDGTGGVLPAMIAEHLQVPQATALSSVTIGEGRSPARAPPTSAPRRSARRCRPSSRSPKPSRMPGSRTSRASWRRRRSRSRPCRWPTSASTSTRPRPRSRS